MRLLIADDERNTRNVLRDFLPWDELGIVAISEARDGREALEKAETFLPDLVLSDIRMPKMNGLEFAKAYKSVNEDCRFIFLSAYSDREYLKEAIKLRAVSYVEKPIQLKEVREAVENAISEIHSIKQSRYHQRESDRKKAVLEYTYEPHEGENRPALFWHEFFASENAAYCVAYFRNFVIDESLGADFTQEVFEHCFMTQLQNYIQSRCRMNPDAAKAWIHERFLFACKDPEHLLLLCKRSLLDWDSLKEMLRSLQSHLPLVFPKVRKVLVGLGYPVDHPAEISRSYRSAKNMRKLNFISGRFRSFEEEHMESFSLTPAFIQSSLHSISTLNHEEMLRMLKQLENTLSAYPNSSEDEVRSFYLQLLFALSKRAESANRSLFLEMKDRYITALSECCCLKELGLCLEDACYYYFSLDKQSNTSGVVEKINAFIEENFHMEDLSIRWIAEKIYLSPNYISLLYKQETGITINQKITRFRIHKAKELLKQSNATLAAISVKVGYHDSNYFSKAFKRETGISPKAYRESL